MVHLTCCNGRAADGSAAAWVVGLRGSLTSIPPGFSATTLLYAGSGLTTTMHAWGLLLNQYVQTAYNVPATRPADPTIGRIGYR